MNMTVTQNDVSSVIIADAVFQDVKLNFPGVDTYVEGTILARRQVATAITVASAGNTGNGTVTAAAVVPGSEIPLPGDYILACTFAVADGGVFKLTDPNGDIVADNLTCRVGAGLATTFNVVGMTFTVTDGGTNFIAGDDFTLTVAADGDVVIYAAGDVGGAQIPAMVLTYDVTSTGAGDVSCRALVAGRVRRDKLVIDAGGTVTDRIADSLRSFGIVAETVDELNIADNS